MAFAAVASSVLLASPASAEPRGLSVELRESPAAGAPITETVKLYGASYALVIGIDDYTGGWPRLSNAVKDAWLVAAELERQGFDVTLKTNLKSDDLKRSFQEFFVVKGANPDARLFVWFAGHGYSQDGEGFLVPADAPRPEASTRFKLLALPMRRFGEYVRLAVSKHAYAIFDSCFAGTVFDSQRALPPAAITRATTLPVRQFLTSGEADQTVADDGTFRTLFIRALWGVERGDVNGDGYITASEMGLFLSDRVTNLTQGRQTPRYGRLRDKNFDQGDFFLRSRRPRRRRRLPACRARYAAASRKPYSGSRFEAAKSRKTSRPTWTSFPKVRLRDWPRFAFESLAVSETPAEPRSRPCPTDSGPLRQPSPRNATIRKERAPRRPRSTGKRRRCAGSSRNCR